LKAVEVASKKGGTFLDDTGRLFALIADTVVRIPRRPGQFRGLAEQTWFLASVPLVPPVLLPPPVGMGVRLQV